MVLAVTIGKLIVGRFPFVQRLPCPQSVTLSPLVLHCARMSGIRELRRNIVTPCEGQLRAGSSIFTLSAPFDINEGGPSSFRCKRLHFFPYLWAAANIVRLCHVAEIMINGGGFRLLKHAVVLPRRIFRTIRHVLETLLFLLPIMKMVLEKNSYIDRETGTPFRVYFQPKPFTHRNGRKEVYAPPRLTFDADAAAARICDDMAFAAHSGAWAVMASVISLWCCALRTRSSSE